MKKEQMVDTRLPDTVVRDLEAIRSLDDCKKTSVSGDTGLAAGQLFAAVWQRQAHTCTCCP